MPLEKVGGVIIIVRVKRLFISSGLALRGARGM